MKVTVNFGNVRVIVPCGKGELLVRDLMNLATTRYKKATGKPLESWVTIHNLKSYSDGGILDPDDKLNDVADDREQIIAIYEEQTSPYPSHTGGDGTSASSVGTESPDIFHGGELLPISLSKQSCIYPDVEITTNNNIPSGVMPLQVRRGSEPALNRLSPVQSNLDPTKRWSAAVIVDEDISQSKTIQNGSLDQSDDDLVPSGEREDGSGEEKSSHFSRGLDRLSVLSGHAAFRWETAAEKHAVRDKRREPLGGPRTSPEYDIDNSSEISSNTDDRSKESVIVLKNEAGPLGIHVASYCDENGRNKGLVIQSIEPGGRIDLDGRLNVGDCIMEISGRRLEQLTFQKAQDIFREALKAPEINLRLIRNTVPSSGSLTSKKHPPPPVYPKPTFCHESRNETEGDDSLTEGEERGELNTKIATVTPTKKVPPVVPSRSPTTILSANTKKLGKKIHIQLTKGPDGLGFSIATRDNPAGGVCPIYIKSILPKGAAVKDGRLKSGDRLLEANGIDMTGKSQAEVANILRKTPHGGTVDLLISRQEPDSSPSPSLPRELPPDKGGDGVGIFPWKHREVLTFEIPLNDTGSAGLGVSVKGKTSNLPSGAVDMGIFVKSVIHGGAASKDGRLCTNDQLVNINGISLLGMTNSQAMETLRRAMTQGEGPNASPDAITLTVARRIYYVGHSSNIGNATSLDNVEISHSRSDSLVSASGESVDICVLAPSPQENKENEASSAMTPDNSASENSGNTVIFQPSSTKETNNETNLADSLSESKDIVSQLPGRNPVVERLMAQNSGELTQTSGFTLRNESYLRASHESWGGAQLQHALKTVSNNGKSYSQSTNLFSKESALSENDEDSTSKSRGKSCTSEGDICVSKIENNLTLDDTNAGRSKDFSFMSQLSYDENNINFCRDGFGRQSMSEKRHAHLDAHNTDTFQKNKKAREERLQQKHQFQQELHHLRHHRQGSESQKTNQIMQRLQGTQLHKERPVDVGSCNGSCHSPGCPYHAVVSSGRDSGSSRATSIHVGLSLGMKKSSSLESLQTMVQELQKRETEYLPHSACRGTSGRGCNESFRAAVDKSYEAPAAEAMETVEEDFIPVEEESESGSSSGHAQGRPHTLSCPRPISGSEGIHGHLDELDLKKGVKGGKKKGIFRGLGSVFRFGKKNKLPQDCSGNIDKEDKEQNEELQARCADEQERIQEQYKKLIEWHQQQAQNHVGRDVGECISSSKGFLSDPISNDQLIQPKSRQARMQLLRQQHQLRHKERQGHYPLDEQEEWYEKEIKEKVDQKALWRRPLPPIPPQQLFPNYNRRVFPKRHETEIVHSRSQSFDIYKEMSRPGSRMGFADPNKYSHYMNFKEIQAHLRQFKIQQQLKQLQQYQAQHQRLLPVATDTGSSNRALYTYKERPVTNYYEYESMQYMHPQFQITEEHSTNSLPRRSQTKVHQDQQQVPHQFQYTKSNRHEINGQTNLDSYHFHGNIKYPSNTTSKNAKEVPGSKV